jgi:hypothetical protein
MSIPIVKDTARRCPQNCFAASCDDASSTTVRISMAPGSEGRLPDAAPRRLAVCRRGSCVRGMSVVSGWITIS